MKRMVKDVVKEQELVVEIGKEEFIKLAAMECTKVVDELGMDCEMDVIITMICARFSAQLTSALFDDK